MAITYGKYMTLCDTLTEWAKSYANGTPDVTDEVYDSCYREIKAYELENPDMILETSPTRHVIDGSNGGFRKVAHEVPMISITNANGIDEAVQWVQTVHDTYGVDEFELEYKLDGGGLALNYKDGVLYEAVTRGVDNVGDDITANAVRIQGVQKAIDVKGTFEVRGEVVWLYDDFEAYNEALFDAGKKQIANPRNGATGSMKLTDPYEVERRKLTFISYIVCRGSQSDTQSGDIEHLKNLGFNVPPSKVVTLEQFKEIAEQLRENRFNMQYAIDGIVIKVNQKSFHEKMGYTAKSPNFYKAYKFPPEEKATELIDIEQSIGMSGAITPVAIVKPVSLAMTTVQRCSLHNWDLVEYLGLHKGCHVVIRKAGEIIPELVRCVETGMSKEDYEVTIKRGSASKYPPIDGKEMYLRPQVCPFCGGQLRNAQNESGEKLVAWVCDNPDCNTQMVNKLVNFASRSVMNIRGLGESIIESLVEAGKVSKFDDIYRLTAEDVIGIGNLRAKGAGKLIAAIDASRKNYLHQLIEGFSVPGVGHQASPVIADCINHLGGLSAVCAMGDRMESILGEEAEVKGVSKLIVSRLCKWISSHTDTVMYFVDNGIAQSVKETTVTSAKLAGKVCIMTGVFTALERDKFKELVVANGGTICSGISKKTNIVLLGDNAGPKKVAAINDLKASGVHIDVYTPSTLQDFLKLME